MTTQHHEGTIPIPKEAWAQGGSGTQSYISPWHVTMIKHRELDRYQDTLTAEIVAEAITQLHSSPRWVGEQSLTSSTLVD